MSRKAFSKIKAGLDDAAAFMESEREGFRVHVPEDIDVRAIRKRTALSQPVFAARIGVSVGTLRNWEQRTRKPEGPARVLLALLDRNPRIVEETLTAS